MKKWHINYKLIIFLILLSLITIFNIQIKEVYNNFINIFTKDKLIYSDEFISSYINNLENRLKEIDEIKSLDSCIPSTVLYRNINTWYDEFIVNKGKKDGVLSNSLVINNNGVVGVITKVYDTYSIVSLITNTNLKLSVEIKNDNEISYGLISNYDKINNEIIITDVTRNITKGVVTSSYSNKIKDGVLIGNVVRSERDLVSYTLYVKPSVDTNDIKYVCIV